MEHVIESPTWYEIRIAGRLGPEWADWFDGLSVVPQPDGTTLLTGMVADQAALHGHLSRIRDLALTLLAVRRLAALGP